MTQLKLDALSDRIKAHKTALVHIVKPPVCTERAQHYTEMYQQHLDKPIPVRRALALAHHLAERTIWIKHDETDRRQPGKRSAGRADFPGIYRLVD
ncbi:formate acetyltransferase 3 [Salmonella enterica subsp. salamae]|nr:formate acetyltransferase 3 [Salmonella enterica subsp. salamae]